MRQTIIGSTMLGMTEAPGMFGITGAPGMFEIQQDKIQVHNTPCNLRLCK